MQVPANEESEIEQVKRELKEAEFWEADETRTGIVGVHHHLANRLRKRLAELTGAPPPETGEENKKTRRTHGTQNPS